MKYWIFHAGTIALAIFSHELNRENSKFIVWIVFAPLILFNLSIDVKNMMIDNIHCDYTTLSTGLLDKMSYILR